MQLDLKDFEHKTAGSLSGGNKRKLSVAVATVGEPSIVFLDEPSTGMDPVARRFMWKGGQMRLFKKFCCKMFLTVRIFCVYFTVIARMTAEDAACSVILTTHSMEEAEALCSRIGVSKCTFFRCVSVFFRIRCEIGVGRNS